MEKHASILQISGSVSADSPRENYDYLVSNLENVTSADIAVTGELFLGRNSERFKDQDFWDDLYVVLENIEALAKEKNMGISVGYPYQGTEATYIRQSVYFPDKLPFHYDKVHLGKNEKRIYKEGHKIDTFEFRGVRYGIQLCIDTHVVEMTIMQKLEGASVILAPFNTPYDVETRMNNWMKYIPARAYEYDLCIFSQNTAGGSFSCDGKGAIMETSWAEKGSVLTHIYSDEHYHDKLDYMTYRRPELYKL